MTRTVLLHFAKLLLTLSLLYPGATLIAQDGDEQEQAPVRQPPAANRDIEQITVIGERSLLTIQNQIRRIEEDMYRAFNELNSSDEFDIFCSTESKTTSHIRQRSCEPAFLLTLKKTSAQAAIAQIRYAFTDEGLDLALLEYGLDLIESDAELQSQVQHKYDELAAEILRVATENPDYMDALLQIARLKEEYEAARQQKFGRDR